MKGAWARQDPGWIADLTVAVGSFDGDAREIVSILASRLAAAREAAMLIFAARRLDGLIHHRRLLLIASAVADTSLAGG